MYNCENCKYDCQYESHWIQHLNSKKHNNKGISVKKYSPQCEFCNYYSNNSTNMKVHKLTKHSTPEERKKSFTYYCDSCDFGTLIKILFDRHLETTKHKEKTKNIQ